MRIFVCERITLLSLNECKQTKSVYTIVYNYHVISHFSFHSISIYFCFRNNLHDFDVRFWRLNVPRRQMFDETETMICLTCLGLCECGNWFSTPHLIITLYINIGDIKNKQHTISVYILFQGKHHPVTQSKNDCDNTTQLWSQ